MCEHADCDKEEKEEREGGKGALIVPLELISLSHSYSTMCIWSQPAKTIGETCYCLS